MMGNQEYKEIRQQLNFTRGLGSAFGFLIVDGILLFLALHWIQSASVTLYVVSQLALAIVMLHAFLWVHECGHNTLSKSKTINALIGHFYSIFCFMPFYTWKFIHEEHHKWTGHIDKDPVFALLKDAKKKKKLPWIFHFGWRTFIPLNVFFLYVVYWRYPLTLKRENKLNLFILKHCLFSMGVLVVSYALLYWLMPANIHFYSLLPALVLYALMWETLSTPQHLGLEPTSHRPQLKDHINTTRSTWFPTLLQRYLFLNFGYHIEHHLFPALPWHELEKAHGLLKNKLGNHYNMVTGGKWNVQMRSQNMEIAIGVHNSDS
ncbi:hypothetical protein D6J03_12575 [Legionella taurinensis]|uniref:fatty acid desaturase family protein n=2 Tax=Legionella TaxID=445 RepID=UPI000E751FF1|nr:fatty acid desaturase [Legionella taurinensis]RJT65462.1 hypothetical protein D6J03_12575 [Legionella taurinensis]